MPPDHLDPRAPRFAQGLTGSLLAAGLALDLAPVVPAVAVVLGLGALLGPRWNLWGLAYRVAVAPWLPPPRYLKPAAPTRFANLLGFVFLGAATPLVFLTGTAALVGWALAAAVAGLALVAAATDLCVGCRLYGVILRVRAFTAR